MKILTNGEIITEDMVVHENPVALVNSLSVQTLSKTASVEFIIFHNMNALLAGAKPIKHINYRFGPTGGQIIGDTHPFEVVFEPTEENPDPGMSSFFNYITSLPEWEGWTEV